MTDRIRFNARGHAQCGCVVTEYRSGWEVEACALHGVSDGVRAVTRALGDAGRRPDIHHRAIAQLRSEWPVLYVALTKITGGSL